MIFGQMGLIFDLTWKIPGVLNCIPGVKLPKYTYILIHFNTVGPSPKISVETSSFLVFIKNQFFELRNLRHDNSNKNE